jgi:hypothetical protein
MAGRQEFLVVETVRCGTNSPSPHQRGRWSNRLSRRGTSFGCSDVVDLSTELVGFAADGGVPDLTPPTAFAVPELRQFHAEHVDLLNFPIFWIDDAMRRAIARTDATAGEGAIEGRAPAGGRLTAPTPTSSTATSARGEHHFRYVVSR